MKIWLSHKDSNKKLVLVLYLTFPPVEVCWALLLIISQGFLQGYFQSAQKKKRKLISILFYQHTSYISYSCILYHLIYKFLCEEDFSWEKRPPSYLRNKEFIADEGKILSCDWFIKSQISSILAIVTHLHSLIGSCILSSTVLHDKIVIIGFHEFHFFF